MSDLNITVEGGKSKRLLVAGTLPRRNIVVTAEGGNPVLQEKTITENGEYTADSGYDGLSKVTVNVPSEVVEEYDGTVLFLISFTIDGTEYQALEGMTWLEWCNSEYNTPGYSSVTAGSNSRAIGRLNANLTADAVSYNEVSVSSYDTIVSGRAYVVVRYASGGGGAD